MRTDNPNSPSSNKTNLLALEMSTLKRREIQSPIIACLIREFISEIGQDQAMEIASAAIQRDAIKVGKILAEKYGGERKKKNVCFLKEGGGREKDLGVNRLGEKE